MGLFDKIFRPEKSKESIAAIKHAEGYFQTFTSYRPVFTSWSGMIYESQFVRAAIDARARHISKLKIEVTGSAKPSLQSKLKQGMNQFQTNSQFLYRTSTILDVNNTAFIVPVVDEYNVTTGYYPVLPSRCEIVEYRGEPWLLYKFKNGDIGAIEFYRCAVLTKHQYGKDFFGDSNLPLDDTMKLIHINNQGIEEAVKQTSTIRFMAQLDNFSKSEDVAKERKRFTEANLSAEAETDGFLLFPSTYKNPQQINVKPYTVEPEQLKQIHDNISNYFGVNEKILQNLAHGEELEAFYDGAIEPFAIQFSEAMTKAIFTERERAQGNHLIANANRLQYMSVTQKVQMAKELGDRGAILIDEIRELFNYPPLPDGAGQVAPIRGEYKATDTLTGEEVQEEDNNASEE